MIQQANGVHESWDATKSSPMFEIGHNDSELSSSFSSSLQMTRATTEAALAHYDPPQHQVSDYGIDVGEMMPMHEEEFLISNPGEPDPLFTTTSTNDSSRPPQNKLVQSNTLNSNTITDSDAAGGHKSNRKSSIIYSTVISQTTNKPSAITEAAANSNTHTVTANNEDAITMNSTSNSINNKLPFNGEGSSRAEVDQHQLLISSTAAATATETTTSTTTTKTTFRPC